MAHRDGFRSSALCNFLFGISAAATLTVALPARAEDAKKRDEAPPENESGHRHSKTHIAVDFDFSSALDALGTKAGGGGALRVGQKFSFLLVSLTPELGGSYHAFGGNDETRLYSGFLGGRLGFGKIVEPSVFAHWGVAHLEGLQTRTGTVVDGGLAIDVTLLPLIDFGVHGGYNVMMANADGGALKYMTFGAQAAIVL
jgi:hypothetical protein